MAVRVDSGRLVHAGTVGPHDETGGVADPNDLKAQTRRVFLNLSERLREAGGSLADIVKMTTYLARMRDFPAFAEARFEFLPGSMPAATLIEVPRFVDPGVLVQVEVVAAID